jgi:hypothetical protein
MLHSFIMAQPIVSAANKPFMLNVVMLSVIMLSVIMLSAIMLNVIKLNVVMLLYRMSKC